MVRQIGLAVIELEQVENEITAAIRVSYAHNAPRPWPVGLGDRRRNAEMTYWRLIDQALSEENHD